MNNRRLVVAVTAVATCSLLAFGAIAQDAKGAKTDGTGTVAGLEYPSVDKEKIAKMSNQEMLTESQSGIGKMKKTQGEVKTLLSQARAAKPVNYKKLNCINKQLLSINGHLKISTQNYTKLKDATKRTNATKGKRSGPAHYTTLISASALTVERKGQKARLCLADPKDYGDEGNSILSVADDIPKGYEPITGSGKTESEAAAEEQQGTTSTNPEQVMELTPFGG